MFLVVPFVALCAFAITFLIWIGITIHQGVTRRRGGAPTSGSLWWRRSAGQLTLIFFLLFLVTRVYYLL